MPVWKLFTQLCCFDNKLLMQKFDLICKFYDCSSMSECCGWCFLLCLFPLWPVVHFRYSERSGGGPNLPFSLEGLCAHHGQTLAAQLAGGSSPRPQGQGRGHMPSSYPGNLPLLLRPSILAVLWQLILWTLSAFETKYGWNFTAWPKCAKFSLVCNILNILFSLNWAVRHHISLLQLTKLCELSKVCMCVAVCPYKILSPQDKLKAKHHL